MPGILFHESWVGAGAGQLANSTRILERDPGFRDMRLRALQAHFRVNHRRQRIEDYAVALLEEGKTAQAWQVLLTLSNYHVHA